MALFTFARDTDVLEEPADCVFKVPFYCRIVIPTKYVGIKCQLDATEVFIADLIACSTCFGHHYTHHQELKSIIQWLLPVVFRVVVFKLLVWCGAEGYVSGLQDAALLGLFCGVYTKQSQ